MFSKTNLSIDSNLLDSAINSVPNIDFKLSLNYPTGSFFYDRWEIKEEFKNTVWQEILESLPNDIGEARLIKLEPGTNYRSHADIDDRYHLSIISDRCFYIDLDNEALYPMPVDGNWYMANAGIRHSAANFGKKPRIQLVVRQLLNPGSNIEIPVKIKINPKTLREDIRFIFDDTISPLLNQYSKKGMMADFEWKDHEVKLTLDETLLPELVETLDSDFILSYEH
jgi:hypothetical protein